jgi:hypothetical protein
MNIWLLVIDNCRPYLKWQDKLRQSIIWQLWATFKLMAPEDSMAAEWWAAGFTRAVAKQA